MAPFSFPWQVERQVSEIRSSMKKRGSERAWRIFWHQVLLVSWTSICCFSVESERCSICGNLEGPTLSERRMKQPFFTPDEACLRNGCMQVAGFFVPRQLRLDSVTSPSSSTATICCSRSSSMSGPCTTAEASAGQFPARRNHPDICVQLDDPSDALLLQVKTQKTNLISGCFCQVWTLLGNLLETLADHWISTNSLAMELILLFVCVDFESQDQSLEASVFLFDMLMSGFQATIQNKAPLAWLTFEFGEIWRISTSPYSFSASMLSWTVRVKSDIENHHPTNLLFLMNANKWPWELFVLNGWMALYRTCVWLALRRRMKSRAI